MRAVILPITAAVAALAGAAAGSAATGDALKVAGSEVRSKFFTDCYRLEVSDTDGRLTRADLDDDSQPKRIQVEVLYGGDLPDMPEGWSEELLPVLPEREEAALREAYKSLTEGDIITLDYTPGKGSTLRRNDDVVLRQDGYALTAAMLDVWFGRSPVSDDIKEAFLGD